MNQERLFLDTVFIQALLNKNDQYHIKKVRELIYSENFQDIFCLNQDVQD
jgi:hypothetical protein